MGRKLYCSTGAIVGRDNGFNYHIVTDYFPRAAEAGLISGGELMMLIYYYDKLSAIAEEFRKAGIVFPVLHCEKEVGTKLSDAGAAADAGEAGEARRILAAAADDFRKNCEMCAMVGAERMVLHLWGGFTSDRFAERNIEYLAGLREILRPYGVRLLIENVPSSAHDPLSNWRAIIASFGGSLPADCGLIFDTRFGRLHRQIEETWADETIRPRIEHVHISDTKAAHRDFRALRPILHPGEGEIDFPAFAQLLDAKGYEGTFTLESPVMTEGGADLSKLTRTLENLNVLFSLRS